MKKLLLLLSLLGRSAHADPLSPVLCIVPVPANEAMDYFHAVVEVVELMNEVQTGPVEIANQLAAATNSWLAERAVLKSKVPFPAKAHSTDIFLALKVSVNKLDCATKQVKRFLKSKNKTIAVAAQGTVRAISVYREMEEHLLSGWRAASIGKVQGDAETEADLILRFRQAQDLLGLIAVSATFGIIDTSNNKRLTITKQERKLTLVRLEKMIPKSNLNGPQAAAWLLKRFLEDKWLSADDPTTLIDLLNKP